MVTHAKRRKGNGSRGFTLLEMIVAITLFSVLVSSASNIFLMASRAQRKMIDFERMQAAARFTMEAMVREIRMGRVDYPQYAQRESGPLETPDRELALQDADFVPIRFFESDTETEVFCPDQDSRPCLLATVGDSDPSPVSPKGIKVHSVAFYISPDVDPTIFDVAAHGFLSDRQPTVTILLVFESATGKASERSIVHLQTTVTSRLYVR